MWSIINYHTSEKIDLTKVGNGIIDRTANIIKALEYGWGLRPMGEYFFSELVCDKCGLVADKRGNEYMVTCNDNLRLYEIYSL